MQTVYCGDDAWERVLERVRWPLGSGADMRCRDAAARCSWPCQGPTGGAQPVGAGALLRERVLPVMCAGCEQVVESWLMATGCCGCLLSPPVLFPWAAARSQQCQLLGRGCCPASPPRLCAEHAMVWWALPRAPAAATLWLPAAAAAPGSRAQVRQRGEPGAAAALLSCGKQDPEYLCPGVMETGWWRESRLSVLLSRLSWGYSVADGVGAFTTLRARRASVGCALGVRDNSGCQASGPGEASCRAAGLAAGSASAADPLRAV